mmetsp:Transcript_2432/g.6209  ORF Transcript_2432/g.6209 Transcript_2432/m.6209 type:complete len:375 (-) Transcript_2432:571-1695(-)
MPTRGQACECHNSMTCSHNQPSMHILRSLTEAIATAEVQAADPCEAGAASRLQLVAVGLAEHLLLHKLAHNGNAQGGGDVGAQEVGLGAHVGHDLGPLGHHGVTLALHLGGHGVQQDGVLPHHLGHLLGQEEVVAEQVLPAALVLLARLLGEVAGAAHVQDGLRSRLAAHHGGVDALTGQGVDVAGGVAHNHEVVVHSAQQALAAHAQGRDLHALHLGVGAQRLADEGVLLDGLLVQALEVGLLDLAAVALLAAGDEVVAEAQLVVGVPEDGGVAGQGPAGVEAHTVKVGVVGAALHEGARAHALGGLRAVAHLHGQLGGGAVGDHQHAALDHGTGGGGHGPQAAGLVKLGLSHLKALLEVSTSLGGVLGHAVV